MLQPRRLACGQTVERCEDTSWDFLANGCELVLGCDRVKELQGVVLSKPFEDGILSTDPTRFRQPCLDDCAMSNLPKIISAWHVVARVERLPRTANLED